MIIGFLFALFLGILFGIFTGLIPGLHVNLVSILLLSYFSFFPEIEGIILVILIVSMSITHTFVDFIPSIYLGAPDEDTSLSVLPGHTLLLKGKGREAVSYTLYGGLIGLLVILIMFPLFLFLIPKIYFFIKMIIFPLLILASLFLILREKNLFLAFILFFLSGFLGLSSFGLNLENSLLPLLTGLFGAPCLIMSIIKKEKIPKQKEATEKCKIKKIEFFKVLKSTIFVSPICSFLPSLGSSQAAVFASTISGEKTTKEEFLMLLGSINTIVMGISIIALYSLDITRTGSALVISKILPVFSLNFLFLILLSIFFSGILSFFISLFINKKISKKIDKLNYQILSLIVLFLVFLFVIIFSGYTGILIFLVASSIGLLAVVCGAQRTLLMGAMMLPTIWFYFPFL